MEVLDVQKTSEKRFCEAGTILHFSQVLLQETSPNLALCEITYPRTLLLILVQFGSVILEQKTKNILGKKSKTE